MSREHEFKVSKKFEVMKSGFLNLVYTDGVNVYSHLLSRPTVSRPLQERFEYSLKFLKEFGGSIAPNLVSASFDRRKIVVMEKLEGKNQKELLMELEEKGEQEKIRQAYFQTGESLSIIHNSKNPDGISIPEYVNWFQNKTLEDAKSLIELNKNLPPFYKIDESEFTGAMISTVLPQTTKMISDLNFISWRHGDFWSNNIIGRIENDEYVLSGVIDPEFSCSGSPFEDLAQISSWEMETGNRDMYKEDFEKGYGKEIDWSALTPFHITNALDWLKPVNINVFNEDIQKAVDAGTDPENQFCVMSIRQLQKYIELIHA